MSTARKIVIAFFVSFVLYLLVWLFLTGESRRGGMATSAPEAEAPAMPPGSHSLPEAVPDPDELYRSTPGHPEAIPDPDELP